MNLRMPTLDPTLKQFVLFQDLMPPQLARIASIARERRFPKRHTIFLEGEKGNYVVLIVSGIIKISRSSSDGRVKTLALLRPKDFFGEMALFLPGHERSATAEALTDCRAITIEQTDFEKLLKDVPGISLRIIQTLAHRLQAANRQIKTLALGDSQSKLADLLLTLKDEFPAAAGAGVVIPLTHQELADLAGLSRETTTRMLNALEGEGCVRLKARQVHLTDIDKLKKYAT
jgi:CRP-like cAMP-binding protein